MLTTVNKISKLLPASLRNRLDSLYWSLHGLLLPVATVLRTSIAKFARWIKPKNKPDQSKGCFVNLGCGTTSHPKFINVDGYPHNHVHYIHTIDKLPMFEDESIDLIYASHCLEHFKYRQIDSVLGNWSRKLKPGGVLRLSVPDLDKLLDIYHDTRNPDNFVEQLMGGQDNRYNFHYAIFNRVNLDAHLLRAGLENIREWTPGADELSTFDDFSVYSKVVAGKTYSISMNIEATKAASR